MQFTVKQLLGSIFQFAAVFALFSLVYQYVFQPFVGVEQSTAANSKFSALSAASCGVIAYLWLVIRKNRKERRGRETA